MNRRHIATAVSAVSLFTTAALLNAGPLNPPAGPVAPTYKTVTEVEPRIAINATNTPGDANSLFRITQPGSYYLTGNITGVAGMHGIEIAASGVTLDLNGFIVAGATGTLDGITADGVSRTNISVVNGVVTGWPSDGVDLANTQRAVIRGVRALSNGTGGSGNGIRASNYSVVEDCVASGNAGFGFDIFASCSVVRCEASLNTGNGIDCASGCLIVACTTTDNQGAGIRVDAYCRVTECVVRGNGGDGISVSTGRSGERVRGEPKQQRHRGRKPMPDRQQQLCGQHRQRGRLGHPPDRPRQHGRVEHLQREHRRHPRLGRREHHHQEHLHQQHHQLELRRRERLRPHRRHARRCCGEREYRRRRFGQHAPQRELLVLSLPARRGSAHRWTSGCGGCRTRPHVLPAPVRFAPASTAQRSSRRRSSPSAPHPYSGSRTASAARFAWLHHFRLSCVRSRKHGIHIHIHIHIHVHFHFVPLPLTPACKVPMVNELHSLRQARP